MPFIELGEYMDSLANAILKSQGEGSGDPESSSGDGEIPRSWLQTIRKKASAYAKKRAFVAAQYSDQAASSPDFSTWELEILNSLSQGRTSEAIAADMHISVNMVKSAIRSVYTKLGAANRADAIRIATEKNLLTGA
jgi:LuxR family maltose regulon positive regulatory protein